MVDWNLFTTVFELEYNIICLSLAYIFFTGLEIKYMRRATNEITESDAEPHFVAPGDRGPFVKAQCNRAVTSVRAKGVS